MQLSAFDRLFHVIFQWNRLTVNCCKMQEVNIKLKIYEELHLVGQKHFKVSLMVGKYVRAWNKMCNWKDIRNPKTEYVEKSWTGTKTIS